MEETPDLRLFQDPKLAERFLKLLGKRQPATVAGRGRRRRVACAAAERVLSAKELNLVLEPSLCGSQTVDDLGPALANGVKAALEVMETDNTCFNFNILAVEALRKGLKVRRRLSWFHPKRSVDLHGVQALVVARVLGVRILRALHGPLQDLPPALRRESKLKPPDEEAVFFFADSKPKLTVAKLKWMYPFWETIDEYRLASGRLYVIVPTRGAFKVEPEVRVVVSGETEDYYEWHELHPGKAAWPSHWGPGRGVRLAGRAVRRSLETGFYTSKDHRLIFRAKSGEDPLALLVRTVQEYQERGFGLCQYVSSMTHTSRSWRRSPHRNPW